MSVYHKTIEFDSPINLESSGGLQNISDSAKSEIEIYIDKSTGEGWFEWDVPELEITESGMLIFEGNELVDYDGVMSLPHQLIKELQESGFNMDHAL